MFAGWCVRQVPLVLAALLKAKCPTAFRERVGTAA